MCACSNGWLGVMGGTICVPAPMDDQGSWEVPYVYLLQWMVRDHGRYHMCACSNGWSGVMGGTICVPAP